MTVRYGRFAPRVFGSALALALCLPTGISLAQGTSSAAGPTAPTISSVYEMHLTAIEQFVVTAAERMPEDRYSFAPSSGSFSGVRTFAEQVKHITAANRLYFGTLLGWKMDLKEGTGNGPDSVRTKAQILRDLRDSYALGHRALGTITAENVVTPLPNAPDPFIGTRLAAANIACWHALDHYGQMVEYLRMNGIVPPASRPRSD